MRSLSITLAAVALLVARPARANGRFPAANQLTVDPSDPKHIVVSTTFGLLESRDGGKTFDYRCELALGITGEEDTMSAITANGTTVVATFTGVLTSSDGCTYRTPLELRDQIVPDLALSRSTPHEVMAFHEIGLSEGNYDTQVVRSGDDGQTWSDVGPPLPTELFPLTIDIAPSDRRRVYLSGYLGKADDFASVLLRSDDGGASFERHFVPETTGMRAAYIAAVHPIDVDRIYVRVNDFPGTVIWSSDDGGQTFHEVFTGVGKLLGFAISPDGGEIAFGGKDDGLYVGPSDGTAFERRSDVGALCLTWTDDALYACADAKISGFSIGRSRDKGATFESLLAFDKLCGATECDRSTQVGMSCPENWEQLAPRLGTTCGVPDAGVSTPPDASGDAPSDVTDAEIEASRPELELSGGCSLGRFPTAPGGASREMFVSSDGYLLIALTIGWRRSRRARRKMDGPAIC